MNKKIEDFKRDVSQVINNSQLPSGVVYYVLKDVLLQVSQIYQEQIKEEEKKEEAAE